MKKLLLLIFFVFLYILSSNDFANKITSTSLSNFYKASEELYRSEQPNSKEMLQIESLGIKSILNLREFHTDNKEARKTNLNLYHVKMDAGDFGDKEIIEALKIIKDAPKPILVHCWHGSDRTGVVVAMYRIVFQNWDKQAAIDELLTPQYGHHKNYYKNIVKYIENSNVENLKNIIKIN